MKIMKWEQYLQRLLKYHVSIKPVFFVQIKQRKCPDTDGIHVQKSLNPSGLLHLH